MHLSHKIPPPSPSSEAGGKKRSPEKRLAKKQCLWPSHQLPMPSLLLVHLTLHQADRPPQATLHPAGVPAKCGQTMPLQAVCVELH